MSRDELTQLRGDLADLTAAVLRLESVVELLRHHLARITERLSGLELGTLTPPPRSTGADHD